MKKLNILLFFFFLKVSFSNLISSKSKTPYFSLLRNLWEEDMEIPSGRPNEDEKSLKRCPKSDYKYFNFVLSGANVSFSHSVTEGISVR